MTVVPVDQVSSQPIGMKVFSRRSRPAGGALGQHLPASLAVAVPPDSRYGPRLFCASVEFLAGAAGRGCGGNGQLLR